MKILRSEIKKGTPLVIGGIAWESDERKHVCTEAYEVVRVEKVWANGVIAIPKKGRYSKPRTFDKPSSYTRDDVGVEMLYGRGSFRGARAMIIAEEDVPQFEAMVARYEERMEARRVTKATQDQRNREKQEASWLADQEEISQNIFDLHCLPVVALGEQGERVQFKIEYERKAIELDFTWVVTEEVDDWNPDEKLYKTYVVGFYRKTYLDYDDRVHFHTFHTDYRQHFTAAELYQKMVRYAS